MTEDRVKCFKSLESIKTQDVPTKTLQGPEWWTLDRGRDSRALPSPRLQLHIHCMLKHESQRMRRPKSTQAY